MHRIYTQPGTKLIVTVPVRDDRELKSGTLGKLLRDAGLGEVDL
jgi:predicted RNA binding protein YcfA (HicA-like mRNA interferase family)